MAVPTSIGLTARLVVAHLERKRVDPAPLLRRVGLSGTALSEGQRISAQSQMDLLDFASRALADDWIGLTLAADFDLRKLGVLYYVAASSSRLVERLQRLDR